MLIFGVQSWSKQRFFMIFENVLKQVKHKNNFHFNMRKIEEKFSTGPQYINVLVIGFKEIGVVSIG